MIGNNIIQEHYLGSQKICEVYLGQNLIFSQGVFDFTRIFDGTLGTVYTSIEVSDMDVTSNEIYLVAENADKIIIGDLQGNYLREFGIPRTVVPSNTPGKLIQPQKVKVYQDEVYVFSNKDAAGRKIQVFDNITGNFIRLLNGNHDQLRDYHFYNGEIYMTFINSVSVYDLNGDFVRSIGVQGTGVGELGNTGAIHVHNGRVYVYDITKSTIHVYNSTTGIHILSFGGNGTLDGEFSFVNDITVYKGKVFALDTVRKDTQAFDTQGNYLFKTENIDSANSGYPLVENFGTRLRSNSQELFALNFRSNGSIISRSVQVFSETC